MYFISEQPCSDLVVDNEDFCDSGSLIGIHGQFSYFSLASEDGIKVYRKKTVDTGDWDLVWSYGIASRSICFCVGGVSVAHGIVEDELFIVVYGRKSCDSEVKLHVASMNLLDTNVITEYRNTLTRSDLHNSICNKCVKSFIVANPTNPSEIIITPWSPQDVPSSTVSSIECYQIKLKIDADNQICTMQDSFVFSLNETKIQSNLGLLGYGRILCFQNDELVLARGEVAVSLGIVQESHLKSCQSAGFYSLNSMIFCLALEGDDADFRMRLYTVVIDEEKMQAK